MAWTTPFTATAGVVLTAAIWNASVRDDVNADHAVLSGTAQAFGTVFYPTTDTGYHLDLVSGDPQMIWDTSDFMWYLRSTNIWTVVIGGNSVITVDANGKITGKGFYDSGEVSVLNGNTATVSHGLANRPRFYSAFSNTTTGSADTKRQPQTSTVLFPSATQMSFFNSTGGTVFIEFYAQQ